MSDAKTRKLLLAREDHCFTCGVHKNATYLQVGHFVSRRVKHLRHDERNVHLQCVECNISKGGNLKVYAQRLGPVAVELKKEAKMLPKRRIGKGVY
ncbi:MAG: recombination protein NinG [Spirochaetia bacterium]